jgi:hypothetical protein
MYVVHTIWRIGCIDGDEQWWTDVDGRKGPDGWMLMDVSGRKGPDRRMLTDVSGWKGSNGQMLTDVTRRKGLDGRIDKRQIKLWQTATSDNIDETTTDGDGRQLRQTGIATGDNNNARWWTVTAIVMDDNGVAKWSTSTALQQWLQKIRENFFFYFMFFFFAFSTNFAICSFDHSCKKLAEREIEKWRKLSVYRFEVPSANLHEELK